MIWVVGLGATFRDPSALPEDLIFNARNHLLLDELRARGRVLFRTLVIVAVLRIFVVLVVITRSGNLGVLTSVVLMTYARHVNFLLCLKWVARGVIQAFAFAFRVRVRLRTIGTARHRGNRFVAEHRFYLRLRLSIGGIQRRQRAGRFRRRLRVKLTGKVRMDDLLPGVPTPTWYYFENSRDDFSELAFNGSFFRTRVGRETRHSQAINEGNSYVGFSFPRRIHVSSARQSTYDPLHNGIISVKGFCPIRVRAILQQATSTSGRVVAVARKERDRAQVATSGP